jgi:hypothetical protein
MVFNHKLANVPTDDGVLTPKYVGMVTVWQCIFYLQRAFVGQIKCNLENARYGALHDYSLVFSIFTSKFHKMFLN